MNEASLVEVLVENHACPRSVALANTGALAGMTPALAWEQWHYSPDLLWIASTVGVDRHLVTRAACDCALLVLPCLTDDVRFTQVITTVEQFTEDAIAQAAIIDAIAALPCTDSTADLKAARLNSAKRMVTAVAATTWLDQPELANAAADAVVQTYRIERNGFRLSADVVRARIPWSEVSTKLRTRRP
jgi:hypothetical protein